MNIERIQAAEASRGARGAGAGAAEALHVTGRFDAVLRRALPQHEREFLRLQRHLVQLHGRVAQRERLFRALPVGQRLSTGALRREAGAVEAYMQTLTEVQGELVAPNLVTTVGKNYLLDNGLAGSGFTAAYYMGLISSTSWSAVNAADTMSSHAGWLEAGNANAPTYSGARKTAAWSAASSGSKALSAGLVFTFTGSGTVKGPFLTTVATVDGTTGTLYSAGTFTGGDQPVVSTNTLTVTYTASA
jgi:hypothetical protein